MNDRLAPLFESLQDERKETKQAFIKNERASLLDRLAMQEKRSYILKDLMQEIMCIKDSSMSTDSGGPSNRILELLSEDKKVLEECIERAELQREESVRQSELAELRIHEIKQREKPQKQAYKQKIQQLQEINKEKEEFIQHLDQVNSALTEEINSGNAEIYNKNLGIDKRELLLRKRETMIEIIQEIREENQGVQNEITRLTDTFLKLKSNWETLNSMMVDPKEFTAHIELIHDTHELTRDDFWQRDQDSESLDIPPTGKQTDSLEREYEKQFIKLETLREELNAAKRLNDALKSDRQNLKKGLKANKKIRDSIMQNNCHGRANSNPFDYILKPAFKAKKKDSSDELNFSNLAENQSIIESIEDESRDESILNIFS